jgi:hypothetical protein
VCHSPLPSPRHDRVQHLQRPGADAAPSDLCNWANSAGDWTDSKFDAASTSVVVGELDWTRADQLDPSPKNCAVTLTLLVSLRRLLKLFKSQSRASLLQRAYYTWHNLLRMCERRRWISCFCQKM